MVNSAWIIMRSVMVTVSTARSEVIRFVVPALLVDVVLFDVFHRFAAVRTRMTHSRFPSEQ